MLAEQSEHDLKSNTDRRSILIGCPSYGSAEELVANANDLHGWAAAVRKLDPSVRNDGNKMAAAGEWKALDAYAQVWLPQHSTHTDGVFRG